MAGSPVAVTGPQGQLLATSREALGVTGEQTCRVSSLPDLQQKPTVESRMQSESEGTMMAASTYQAYPL